VADPTEQLTTALAAGDVGAVERFYRQYFDYLYAQARRATRRDESFCLDVVQDAVLRVIRNVRPVRSEPALRAWLRLVVQTVAWDRLRADRRRRRHEHEAAAARTAVVATDENENGGGDATVQAWLRGEIAKLDPQIVQLIELRFGRRMTLARIGAMLGVSTGTIDGRLRRALRQLGTRAAVEFDDD
jgi:RNA polymerase sigma factor (sigma-70 family)